MTKAIMLAGSLFCLYIGGIQPLFTQDLKGIHVVLTILAVVLIAALVHTIKRERDNR